MARKNGVRHNFSKCACSPDAPQFGTRKMRKREFSRHGMILSAIDTGTQIGHDSITFVGQEKES